MEICPDACVGICVNICLQACTVPGLKRWTLRASWGYISSQCRLRSTQWPPGRSMDVINSENAPGLNSWTLACGPSVCGRRTAALLGIRTGYCAVPGDPPQNLVRPWLPRSPGPLRPPVWPSPSLIELRHLFGTCCGGPWGVPAPEGPRTTMISPAQGGTRGVRGSKGARSRAPKWTL